MSSAGRNLVKIVVGSAVGAAVAAAVTSAATKEDKPDEQKVPFTVKVQNAPANFKNRWEQAKLAGEDAEEETIAQLTAQFRAKTNDPEALHEPNSPSS